jgi:hypothetical protein
MGLFSRRTATQESIAGFSAAESAELRRMMHKDLRGAGEVIRPHLEPGETLTNFFKTPGRGDGPTTYTFLTDRYVHIAMLSGLGEVVSWPHECFIGMRVQAGYVRLGYEVDGEARFPHFFASGGPMDCVAFYLQFVKAWEARTGKTFDRSRQLDQPDIPPFEFV